jgi:predicted component of type VI protein secretion system
MQVRFRVVQGQPMGKLLLFPIGREVIFGRGAECDVRANSEWVSRQHCLLRVAKDRAVLCDLGSRNGTLVNGERVVGERQLSHHDQVQVGPLVFEVELEATDPTRSSDAIATFPAMTSARSAPGKPGTAELQAADTQEVVDIKSRSKPAPPQTEDRSTEDVPLVDNIEPVTAPAQSEER